MNKLQVSILAVACCWGIRANAATIAVTYNFAGGPVGPEIQSGTNLTIDMETSNPCLGYFGRHEHSRASCYHLGWNTKIRAEERAFYRSASMF